MKLSYRAKTEAIFAILKNQLRNTSKFCVVGDFNFRNINWNNLTSSSAEERNFLEMIHELNLSQNVRDFTREKAVLDLCLSPNDNSIPSIKFRSCTHTAWFQLHT